MYSYRIYHQIKSIFRKEILHIYHPIDVDGVYHCVHADQRYHNLMIGMIHHPYAQYLDTVFPRNVFCSRYHGIRNMDIQNLHQVQRDQMARDAYQFLNVTLNFLIDRIYLLYDSFITMNRNPDSFCGNRIYLSAYKS